MFHTCSSRSEPLRSCASRAAWRAQSTSCSSRTAASTTPVSASFSVPLTMMTGVVAPAATLSPTDPSMRELKPPNPRLPTTMVS
ncbi:hypothetical protein [Streptomyces yangpuensis]|uniref:hypothetical protein n=1 Tax=Streptomyces yangpuensis TaxID=1648182 RepID=UPI00365E134E